MVTPELASDGMSVVVLGEFDPLQVTPRWLRQMDLIGEEDYDSFRTEIISSNATIVNFESVQLRVLPDSLQVTTDAAEDVEVARDLAAGILLSHGSPEISALGINRAVHFGATIDGYHAIGDQLTPKVYWEGVIRLSGMLGLGINGLRGDGNGGSVNIQVQPSTHIRPGVYVSINDHYTLTRMEMPADRNAPADPEQINPPRAPEKIPIAVSILTEDFGASRNRSQSIIDRVASLASPKGDVS